MRRRVRVLHVVQNLNYGGMERLIVEIAGRVDPARFESHVLVLEYLGRYAQDLHGTAMLHRAPAMPRWSMLRPSGLARAIARIGPDVVHTHSGVWYKASLAARLAGVPRLVHTEHGRHSPDPLAARIIDGLASRRTDAVVAVSDALAMQLADTIVSEPHRIRVVPNGVDPHVFRPRADTGAVRRELGLPADVSIIGSIGRLELVKGYDVMIEAFARLRASRGASPEPVLVLAGDGAERRRLEERARAAGVADAVHFLGWRDDVHDLHDAFTIFTMSSRSEGTSVSLLEAMSACLCPVVTDVGGNRSLLGEHLRHRLVATDEPDQLTAAWVDALTISDRRRADAAAARARVIEAFSLDAMVRAYEALYEPSVEGGDGAARRARSRSRHARRIGQEATDRAGASR